MSTFSTTAKALVNVGLMVNDQAIAGNTARVGTDPVTGDKSADWHGAVRTAHTRTQEFTALADIATGAAGTACKGTRTS